MLQGVENGSMYSTSFGFSRFWSSLCSQHGHFPRSIICHLDASRPQRSGASRSVCRKAAHGMRAEILRGRQGMFRRGICYVQAVQEILVWISVSSYSHHGQYGVDDTHDPEGPLWALAQVRVRVVRDGVRGTSSSGSEAFVTRCDVSL